MKIRHILGAAAIIIVCFMLLVKTDTNFNYEGYVMDSDDHNATVILKANFYDEVLHEDTIHIILDGHEIAANVLITQFGKKTITGNIIKLDREHALDKIIGNITIIKNKSEVLIDLYEENIRILAPADSLTTAKEKLKKFTQ